MGSVFTIQNQKRKLTIKPTNIIKPDNKFLDLNAIAIAVNIVLMIDPEAIPLTIYANTPLVVPNTPLGKKMDKECIKEECIRIPVALLVVSCLRMDKLDVNSLPNKTAIKQIIK